MDQKLLNKFTRKVMSEWSKLKLSEMEKWFKGPGILGFFEQIAKNVGIEDFREFCKKNNLEDFVNKSINLCWQFTKILY